MLSPLYFYMFSLFYVCKFDIIGKKIFSLGGHNVIFSLVPCIHPSYNLIDWGGWGIEGLCLIFIFCLTWKVLSNSTGQETSMAMKVTLASVKFTEVHGNKAAIKESCINFQLDLFHL